MKSIFRYDDYRIFLSDFYLEKKRENTAYTYAKFSKDAGLSSPNYLKMVMDGGRNLTVSNIHQFAKALRLEGDEVVYFEAMVLRNQASAPLERTYYERRLSELKKKKPSRGQGIQNREFVARWYIPAIIFSLQGRPENADLGEVARMTGLTSEELRESIQVLIKKKIISIREGQYHCESNHLMFKDPKNLNLAQKNYLKSQLQRSVQAFEKKYESGAKFQSHTFTLPTANFSLYEDKLSALVEEMIAHADQGPAEKVAQLNLQLFTLDGMNHRGLRFSQEVKR